MLKVKFRRRTYLLVGDLQDGGPLATVRQYTTGRVSFAYLRPSGIIERYGQVIGSREDIESLGPVDPPKEDAGALWRVVRAISARW